MIINEATKRYIAAHAADDVRQLALQGSKDQSVDMTLALDQISGRQKAREKLPQWAAMEGIVYPPRLSMEQCSSEMTARYKATLAGNGQRMVDLTGGFGVDFAYMARGFQKAVYVERQEQLCAISSENFSTLGLNHAQVIRAEATEFLNNMGPADLIYIDPARRDSHGERTYGIADCTPNVLEMGNELFSKTRHLILKLSPMLDWHKAVSDLGYSRVKTVHIVSVDNECKELLIEASPEKNRKETDEGIKVVCVNLTTRGENQYFEFTHKENPINSHDSEAGYDDAYAALYDTEAKKSCEADPDNNNPNASEPIYLFEPNASVMKAGCYKEIALYYGVRQIGRDSHLYLGCKEVKDFPGRQFVIKRTTTLNRRELRQCMVDIEYANISVRNFPMTAKALRQRLRLKDGGDVYIFAATTDEGIHQLLVCRKIG